MWLKGIQKINDNKKATVVVVVIFFFFKKKYIVYIFGTFKNKSISKVN